MASTIPPQLKSGEIWRYVQRATQLEKAKPIISYWCNYNVVNLILNKGLHTESDDCMTYTTNLMDKLERFKTETAGNDAVHDDVAAQAYVEQFATETFQRADSALRGRRATAQTADTFLAAASFLDLLVVWQQPLTPEIAAKSKYAKYYALQIRKAIKAGENPNTTISIPEDEPTVLSPPELDPADPEVQRIKSLQPSVEDYPDGETRRPSPMSEDAPPSFIDDAPVAKPSITTSQSPSQFIQSNQGPDVSPLEPEQSNDDYFPNVPSVPTFTADTAPAFTTAPTAGSPMQTSPTTQPTSGVSPQSFYASQQPSPAPPTNRFVAPPAQPNPPPPGSQKAPQTFWSGPPPTAAQQAYITATASEVYTTDDEAIAMASKHAKWAISALNFDDIPTAVKELRNALHKLGAQ